jgi:hypothetical protein
VASPSLQVRKQLLLRRGVGLPHRKRQQNQVREAMKVRNHRHYCYYRPLACLLAPKAIRPEALAEELDLKLAVLSVGLRLESSWGVKGFHHHCRQWNVCASRDEAVVLVLLKAFLHVLVKG